MKKALFAAVAAIALAAPMALLPATAEDGTAHAEAAFKVNPAPIDAMLEKAVADGRIAGVTALVWQGGEEVYANSFGYADREAERPMTRDTMFQVFSMTKPVTGVALMTLWEQGKFDLEDPLSKYLPEFADMKVFAGFDENGEAYYEPAERPIKVIDLMRHTGGLGYGNDPKEYVTYLYKKAGVLDRADTLEETASKLAALPLYYQPGEEWRYSASVTVQARLVEVLSGEEFDAYVKKTILDPLGMSHVTRYVAEADRPRMAAVYNDEDGPLERVPDEKAYADAYKPVALHAGGFGLVAQADDYLRFARMLLNGGELDGVRILKPETIELMATDHLPDTVGATQWLRLAKGEVGFGLDFAVRTAPPSGPDKAAGAVGEFFWDGAPSTLFWVDPENDLVAVMLVQLFPFDQELHKEFRNAVYQGSPYVWQSQGD